MALNNKSLNDLVKHSLKLYCFHPVNKNLKSFINPSKNVICWAIVIYIMNYKCKMTLNPKTS